MNIIHKRPGDQDFKKNELKTCEYILNRNLLPYDYQNLTNSLNSFYEKYRNIADYKKTTLKFHSHFLMEVEGDIHKVIVGANIEGENAINSYFFAICSTDGKDLIRKFHFDFAPPSIDTSQKVPVFHLQYGGTSSPEIQELDIDDDKLETWLSLPRLNHSPMNLALLLDLLFCEFRVEETKKIIENPDWRNLIFKNEKFLVENYISNLYSHINSTRYTNKYLIRDYLYGD